MELKDNSVEILHLLEGYDLTLINMGKVPKRYSLKKDLSKADKDEILSHACYLIKNTLESESTNLNILNQRFGEIQTLLVFAGTRSILDTVYDQRKSEPEKS